MRKKTVTIGLASGLEARPIAMLVQIASQYDSHIYIERSNARVNAKSIMGMMSLSICEGELITITADGTDEDEAIASMEQYLLGSK